jgi:hypothetical protein
VNWPPNRVHACTSNNLLAFSLSATLSATAEGGKDFTTPEAKKVFA